MDIKFLFGKQCCMYTIIELSDEIITLVATITLCTHAYIYKQKDLFFKEQIRGRLGKQFWN